MQDTYPNERLTESVFKRISSNSNLKSNHNATPNSNPNPKAQKCFWENEMTSFFGKVSGYRSCYMAVQP